MSMEYIRKAYGVPAKRGGRLIYTDSNGTQFFCTIKSAAGAYLSVLVDDRVPGYRGRMKLHPTWNIVYLTPWPVPAPAGCATTPHNAGLREWERGALMFASQMIASHDQPSMAADILIELGLSGADCKWLSPYDKKNLMRLQGARGGAIKLTGLREVQP